MSDKSFATILEGLQLQKDKNGENYL